MARNSSPPAPYKVIGTAGKQQFCRRVSLMSSKQCDQCEGFFAALYEFGWARSNNVRPKWDDKQFCSIQCREVYYG